MKRRIALVAQLAAVLCLAFVGTALADNGKQPSDPPGKSGDAPGQEKKADQPAPQQAPAQPQPIAAAPPDQTKATGQKAEKQKPAKTSKPAKAEKPAQSERPQAQPAAVGTAQSSGQGRSDEAHHHVIICHRTGSDSNPYVVINIPLTAWHGGHTTHPIRNERKDILLKDPASRPGSKDGFTKEDCESAAGVTSTPTTTTARTTTTTTTSSVTTTSSAAAAVASSSSGSGPSAAGGSQPTGGVAAAGARAGKPLGGVLGVSAQLGRTAVKGTLPFTGLPLWAVGLVALALIGLGLALRRRSAHRTIP